MSLGAGAIQGWWGPVQVPGTAGQFHGNPVSRNSPASGHQPAPSHWRNFGVETYLTQYLPWTTSYEGWEGLGTELAK